jgi:hypothetical protein
MLRKAIEELMGEAVSRNYYYCIIIKRYLPSKFLSVL